MPLDPPSVSDGGMATISGTSLFIPASPPTMRGYNSLKSSHEFDALTSLLTLRGLPVEQQSDSKSPITRYIIIAYRIHGKGLIIS